MANTTIYPFGVGGQTPSGIGLNAGTFADAYDLAKANNYIFPWMLIDEDEEGESIKKMIWHAGNGEFIDAIGAEVDGKKNGVITVVTNAPCDMSINSKTFSLSTGKNVISFADINATNNASSEPNFYEPGTTTSKKGYIESIDFAGFKLTGQYNFFTSYPNITNIDRLTVGFNGWSNGAFNTMPKLKRVKMSGTFNAHNLDKFFSGCQALVKADLSGFLATITYNSSTQAASNGILEWFYNCSSLKELDIRGVNTAGARTFNSAFSGCSSLEKLIIGNFSNARMEITSSMFNGVSGCTLICTTDTPPVLKNCTFNNGNPVDVHGATYDWVSGHFSEIYVPDSALETYKTNTYIEGGTVGNTGWSYYSDIIKPSSQYNG